MRASWWRRLRLALAGLLVCLLALCATVQISQHLLRRRAERLLSDVESLTVGKTDWAEFQRFQAKWGSRAHYDGQCTPQHCKYWVEDSASPVALVSWSSRQPNISEFLQIPFGVAALLSHSHLPWISSGVTVKDGLVTEASFRIYLYVPKGAGPESYSQGEYTLMGKYDSGIRRREYAQSWVEPEPRSNIQLNKPSGCTNCMSLDVDVDPGVPVASIGSVADFNMDCLTRWHPCVDEADLLPRAEKQYEEEARVLRKQLDRIDRCDYSLEQRFSVAQNIAVARVVSVGPTGPAYQDLAAPTVAFVRLLKGARQFLPGSTMRLGGDLQYQLKRPAQVGEEIAVMYPDDQVATTGPAGVEAYPCGIVPASPETLAKMR